MTTARKGLCVLNTWREKVDKNPLGSSAMYPSTCSCSLAGNLTEMLDRKHEVWKEHTYDITIRLLETYEDIEHLNLSGRHNLSTFFSCTEGTT